MKNHSRIHSRKMNIKHALRKRRISRDVLGFDYYDNLHQYSHNKLHCSCPICRGSLYDYGDNSDKQRRISDQKKVAAMKCKVAEEQLALKE